jgi:transcriptional regulator with XRE-family HTH domain
MAMVRNRLRKVLKREKVTAYRLCKDLKIEQSQLSRYFRGGAYISLKKLEQIADYLGYDVELVKRERSRKGDE